MVAREESVSEVGSDAESGWSGVSDNSSTDSECTDVEASSIASDQDRFDTAYEAFQDLGNDLYYIDLRRYQLPAQEQVSQKEEACARATVALTPANHHGPLDMHGLVGAATIIGCLKYGGSFSGLDDQDDPVFLIRLNDDDLLESPDDSAFLPSLRFSCARVSTLLLW